MDPDTFIERDLPHAPFWEQDGVLWGPDPHYVYPGDPHDHTGYGCYAPCICQAMRSALDAAGAADAFEVVDETGRTAAELCAAYIDQGLPVVFWATLDFQPVPRCDHWTLPNGRPFDWKLNEHCLLLVGYDEDPLLVQRSLAQPRPLPPAQGPGGGMPPRAGYVRGSPAEEVKQQTGRPLPL